MFNQSIQASDGERRDVELVQLNQSPRFPPRSRHCKFNLGGSVVLATRSGIQNSSMFCVSGLCVYDGEVC